MLGQSFVVPVAVILDTRPVEQTIVQTPEEDNIVGDCFAQICSV